MYLKLALRNLARSLKEYTIYFITLVFVVSIVYLFNSIESQNDMMDIGLFRLIKINFIEMVCYNITKISIFIPWILGFLVIYANHYLIKRRKKEFGIYITLGMSKWGISFILFIEVLIIGIASLLVGLIIGVLLSQGLSFVTASLMNATIIEFKFVLSKAALKETIYCFGLIFAVVLVFNSLSMMRIKLIDLISNNIRIKDIKIKSRGKYLLIFILSILILVYTYYNMLLNHFINESWYKLMILMIIGTILFFYGLVGFLQRFIIRSNSFYLKNLNMVVLRDINSNLSTNLISIIFISLMIYITISIFSLGIEMSTNIENDKEDLTQFDLVLWDINGGDIEETLKSRGFEMDKNSKDHYKYNYYKNDFKYEDFFEGNWSEANIRTYPWKNTGINIFAQDEIPIIKLSDYNKIMEELGKDTINLEANQYAIYSDIDSKIPIIEDVLKEDKKIIVNRRELTPSSTEVIDVTTYNATKKSNMCTFIVNDFVVEGLSIDTSFLILEFEDNVVSGEGAVYSIIASPINMGTLELNACSIGDIELFTPINRTGMVYMTTYVSIILLIVCATILGLQQLTQAIDYKERYKYLKNLGVEEKMINKAALIKICGYFLLPLGMSIINAIASMKFNYNSLVLGENVDVMKTLLSVLIIYVVVYGGYIVVTYVGVKQIINRK